MRPTGLDVARADWYPSTNLNPTWPVTTSSGHPRPSLHVPNDRFIVHWVGAGNHWYNPTPSSEQRLRNLEEYGRTVKKPNQYNSSSDAWSRTFEWASSYQGAHAKYNNRAWGHLVMVAGHPPNAATIDAVIDGVRKARRQLVESGMLHPQHTVERHRDVRETGCPGWLGDEPYWSEIAAPLTEQEIPMAAREYIFRHKDYAEAFWIADGSVCHIDQHVIADLRAQGLNEVVTDNDAVIRSYVKQYTAADEPTPRG